MGGVDLDQSKAGSQRAPVRGFERGDNSVDPGVIERNGNRVAVCKRNRAGRDDRPAPFRGCLQPATTFPRQVAACLAPGVCELNTRDSPLALHKPSDPRQRLDMAFIPDTHVARRDPSLRNHGRRLDHHQSHAADRPAAEMNEMPVVGHARPSPSTGTSAT